MGYYMGDYYGIASRRAFGDPGFLSFLKGVGKVVGGALGLGGGGGATKVIEKVVPFTRGGGLARLGETGRGIIKRGVGIVKRHPVLTAAGAAGAIAGAGVEAGRLMRGRAAAPGERRYRRMNPFNPRALRRALKRTHRFAMFAKRIIRTERRYKKPKGRFAIGGYGKRKRK